MKIPSLASVVSAVLMLTSAEGSKMAGNREVIIGGGPAPVGRYEYMVGLLSSANSRPFCGGSLVAPNVVYTAAHCGAPSVVSVGCYNVDDPCEKVQVRRSFQHPSYSSNPPRFDYLVLELASSVNSIEPVYVADSSYANIPNGFDVTIIGWGRTVGTNPNSGSRFLKEANVDVLGPSQCTSAMSGTNAAIRDDHICIQGTNSGGCNGDSGGPVLIRCDNTQRDVMLGVASYVIGSCRLDFPTVYARVSTVDSWFKGVLNTIGASVATPPPANNVCGGSGGGPVPAPVPTPTAPPTDPPVPCFFGFC